ncbi:MAG TPA: DUF2794 domain-containing protein [Stellaceae bacterium]|nr:DUF2794 domain-containing protein [Stellaceae bacterium]
MSTVLRLADYRRKHKRVFFSRPELHQLLSLYSRQVARGEWRDYAIGQQDGTAQFSVFRHTHESPLYTVIKAAPGTGRPADFVLRRGRQCLASGAALADVLPSLLCALGPVPVSRDGAGWP